MKINVEVDENDKVIIEGVNPEFIKELKRRKRFYVFYNYAGFALVWDKNSVGYEGGKGDNNDLYR